MTLLPPTVQNVFITECYAPLPPACCSDTPEQLRVDNLFTEEINKSQAEVAEEGEIDAGQVGTAKQLLFCITAAAESRLNEEKKFCVGRVRHSFWAERQPLLFNVL